MLLLTKALRLPVDSADHCGVLRPPSIPSVLARDQRSWWWNLAIPQFLRKEVIQPQVPLRLPCYDLVPIRELVFGTCVLTVHSVTSDAPPFRGLTGGVYKAQEHIHRSIADLRLLAIPASCRRVAACNPNWAALFGICSTSRSCVPLYAAL
jgi:hypothetical protein